MIADIQCQLIVGEEAVRTDLPGVPGALWFLFFPLEVGGWWGQYQEVITLSLTQLDIQNQISPVQGLPPLEGSKQGSRKHLMLFSLKFH